jgi:hypothetical protein
MRSIEKRLAALERDIAARFRNPLLILAASLDVDGSDLERVRAWIASGATTACPVPRDELRALANRLELSSLAALCDDATFWRPAPVGWNTEPTGSLLEIARAITAEDEFNEQAVN